MEICVGILLDSSGLMPFAPCAPISLFIQLKALGLETK